MRQDHEITLGVEIPAEVQNVAGVLIATDRLRRELKLFGPESNAVPRYRAGLVGWIQHSLRVKGLLCEECYGVCRGKQFYDIDTCHRFCSKDCLRTYTFGAPTGDDGGDDVEVTL